MFSFQGIMFSNKKAKVKKKMKNL